MADTITPVDATVHPVPAVTADNEFFWTAASEGRLVAQRCTGCGLLRHPPAVACPACHCLDHEVVELSGRGEVYSYALLHHPRSPRFQYPVAAVLVDLEEGVRVVSNLVDVDPAAVRVGLPVEVAFEPTDDDDLAVPVFRPRAGVAPTKGVAR
ncbi:Zn-ribbon domain-containing OB-fold protein [Frankia sp. AgB1.9]|uniref:Zn-ribbon domain-containing OB-fold protein n=1 Tax=unclassified Frankia TaxID=2632575 RepID=UPI0019314DF3|nr:MULTISPECIES: Zn-ribbon domain-containing OB-fold protein [unclassified Frankia]MBL7489397.1 Zn-ribbon domain-containing OB-fold protein [Frankia sp. AgW1.1]MBL7548666.1 Zn-ribbon domain-containing OB-fold protein [Frankia sp. AgB1.9]MBL7619264.1 Zn-ribbon domain-containing OB-fold protein [Frankia sp. AgB1.8]